MAKAKSKKITQRRENIAQAVALSKSPSADRNAHVASGYRSGENTSEIASPEVARAVKAKLVRRLITEGAPSSFQLLAGVVKAGRKALAAGDSPTSLQVDAAKSLMQYAGLQAASEDLRIDKTPGEMSGVELEEALRRLEDEHRRRTAIDVESSDSAPSDAPVTGQAIDKVDDLFS